MVHVALTGSNGFLGWHVRGALLETQTPTRRVEVGETFSVVDAAAAVSGAARVIHLAGVNRGDDEDVAEGNIIFAKQLAESIHRADAAPAVVAYANSTQAENDSVYGNAKARAAEILAAAAETVGSRFENVMLPNIFGEHGRPFYNAVTSTFCHLIAKGETPTVMQDKELTLMHAQNVAGLMMGEIPLTAQGGLEEVRTVSQILNRIVEMSETYQRGDIPDIATTFDRDLFNTYRSYTFPEQTPVHLTRHADARGSFFEIIRTHGGTGQSSFSTTAPGISRGDHFHRRKVERFTVLSGSATISLRKIFSDEVFDFAVTGDAPMAVDMPTMWSHKVTNTGNDDLYTSFWTNDIFDPTNPDTIPEAV